MSHDYNNNNKSKIKMEIVNMVSKEQAKLINGFVDTNDKRSVAKRNKKGLEYVNAIIRGDRFHSKILSDLIKIANKNKAKKSQ